MKKNSSITITVIMCICILALQSCMKSNNADILTYTKNKPKLLKTSNSGIHYQSMQCNDGSCSCEMTTSDEDCEMPVSCSEGPKLGSGKYNNFKNYTEVLNTKYSIDEIHYMQEIHLPIHDEDLKKALKNDGFPIK